jgi:hypothetical protein
MAKKSGGYEICLSHHEVVSTGGYEIGDVEGGKLDENWHHVVSVFDGVNIKLFVDGNKVATSGNITAKTVRSPLKIGIDINSFKLKPAATWPWYSGCIDDVRIYNRTLPDDEVKALYKYESKK